MNNTHEVISAFLDDEAFDAGELAGALSDPAGRALLIDLVALRHIVQPDDQAAALPRQRRPVWLPLLAAAALVMAMLGGYLAGERSADRHGADPPSPSRVVQASTWQALPNGGVR